MYRPSTVGSIESHSMHIRNIKYVLLGCRSAGVYVCGEQVGGFDNMAVRKVQAAGDDDETLLYL